MHRLELKERRDLLIPRLEAMGFKIAAEPDGAFYVFVDVADIAEDSQQFCAEKLICKTGVAITPGIDFSKSLLPNLDKGLPILNHLIDYLKRSIERMERFIND